MYNKPRFLASLALMSMVYHVAFPQYALAEGLVDGSSIELINPDNLATLQGNTLIQIANPEPDMVRSIKYVITTAYSSTPDQTDASPFITANGTYVYDGIVACNFLSFGTKVRFPELYGNKVFVVEDRMAKRNSHKIDIWMPSREQALQFGAKTAKVEILQN